jgi:hypothetical protein
MSYFCIGFVVSKLEFDKSPDLSTFEDYLKYDFIIIFLWPIVVFFNLLDINLKK